MRPNVTTWDELAEETPLGQCVAVRDMSARAYMVARRVEEGFEIALVANDVALDNYGAGVHAHFMAVGEEDALLCWVNEMFTDKMKRVRRKGDHGRVSHPVLRVRPGAAPN